VNHIVQVRLHVFVIVSHEPSWQGSEPVWLPIVSTTGGTHAEPSANIAAHLALGPSQ
jgi:hypothetical protein